MGKAVFHRLGSPLFDSFAPVGETVFPNAFHIVLPNVTSENFLMVLTVGRETEVTTMNANLGIGDILAVFMPIRCFIRETLSRRTTIIRTIEPVKKIV